MYDLPTNEKISKKSQKGCRNDRKDVTNPQMRIGYQFGRPNPPMGKPAAPTTPNLDEKSTGGDRFGKTPTTLPGPHTAV